MDYRIFWDNEARYYVLERVYDMAYLFANPSIDAVAAFMIEFNIDPDETELPAEFWSNHVF